MIQPIQFWELVDHFLEVIYSETGCPVVIYDTEGYIIRATETERIGDLHAGAEKIMKHQAPNCAITSAEASDNPLVKEGFSCPIIVDGQIVAGFGITGKLDRVTPLAKVASKTLQAWIKEQENLRKLERSEAKYRSIFNNSVHGIFQVTTDGRLVTANPKLAQIFGYDSPEELLATITDVSSQLYAHPEERQRFLKILEKKGQAVGFTTQVRRKDGDLIDVKINAAITFDQELDTTIAEGHLEDITEKKKAEAAILLSEEKYSKAFNNCPVWVVLSSLETGKYIEVNESFLNTMGYQRHEVIDRTSLDLDTWVNPVDRQVVLNTIREYGKIENFEVKRKTKEGKILNMLFWGEAITIAGEDLFISVSMDISERKLAELEKIELEKALSHAQKMDALGQLVGGIAHDFNNMLGGILGAAEMLALHLPDDSKARKFHKIIIDSAGRSADLTMKLLAFSRNNPQMSTTVDIHEIINETVIILENTIDRRIGLKIDLGAKLSNVVGDPSQLQNAILNLGINSSQAMPSGGTLAITSRNIDLDYTYCSASRFSLTPGNYIEIEVKDTGCGIPAELLDKIFDPFFTTKEQGKGTGLGLAALYGTVQQHKGAVHVSSAVGSGTCFRLLFPVGGDNNAIVKLRPAKKRGTGIVLVVDDEEVMRLTAKAILDDLGYTVVLAENGREALELYKERSGLIDVVVLDMIMPVMNGKDCFKKLIEYDPEACIILSSGFTHEGDLESLKNMGLSGFIRKPYRSSELSQLIHNILHKED